MSDTTVYVYRYYVRPKAQEIKDLDEKLGITQNRLNEANISNYKLESKVIHLNKAIQDLKLRYKLLLDDYSNVVSELRDVKSQRLSVCSEDDVKCQCEKYITTTANEYSHSFTCDRSNFKTLMRKHKNSIIAIRRNLVQRKAKLNYSF